VLDVYKLFYRFSVEKLFFFVDELDLIIILLEYIKKTRMKRCHHMMSLRLNSTCYYRALENLINESCHQSKITQALLHHKELSNLSFEVTPTSPANK